MRHSGADYRQLDQDVALHAIIAVLRTESAALRSVLRVYLRVRAVVGGSRTKYELQGSPISIA
jgi:hypothetical protein